MKNLSVFCSLLVGLWGSVVGVRGSENQPIIQSIHSNGSDLIISASVPKGYRNVVLRSSTEVILPLEQALSSGPLNGHLSEVRFTIPDPGGLTFLRLEAGVESDVPVAKYQGESYFRLVDETVVEEALDPDEKIDHLLNRIAYGPSFADRAMVESIGIDTYIDQQLNPDPELDRNNERLVAMEGELFDDFQPYEDEVIIRSGEEWDYFKGREEPPRNWREIDFEAAGWEKGPTGIGYGDDDDATILDDMRRTDDNPGYLSVYMRKRFQVADPSAMNQLAFTTMFDDGFVAYLNGREIARANMEGRFPRFNATTSGDVDAYPESYDKTVGDAKDWLVEGWNVLAIQLHNKNLTSSDASMNPELVDRRSLTDEVFARIRGVEELQQLVHVRGILAKNQLQSVLAEFWENHFTTDFDKVAEHFEDLRDSDEERHIDDDQAEHEAAQVEFAEYQFFHDNALGNFGDLLLSCFTVRPVRRS